MGPRANSTRDSKVASITRQSGWMPANLHCGLLAPMPHELHPARNPPQPDIAVAPAYHPEFGYLCPSAAVRQRVRLGIISAGIGMLIGAGIALSLMDRRLAESERNERISTVGRTDQDWTAVGQAAESANQAAPVANQSGARTSSISGACKDDDNWSLNRKCRLIKKLGAHAPGAAAMQLATIEIGRIRAAAEIGRPVSAGMNGNQMDGGPSRLVSEAPVPSTAAAEKAAAPAAKHIRHVRVRPRPRDPDADSLKAYAFAPPYTQYYRPGDTYHAGRAALKGSWGWSW
jgi:hypothetical protein